MYCRCVHPLHCVDSKITRHCVWEGAVCAGRRVVPTLWRAAGPLVAVQPYSGQPPSPTPCMKGYTPPVDSAERRGTAIQHIRRWTHPGVAPAPRQAASAATHATHAQSIRVALHFEFVFILRVYVPVVSAPHQKHITTQYNTHIGKLHNVTSFAVRTHTRTHTHTRKHRTTTTTFTACGETPADGRCPPRPRLAAPKCPRRRSKRRGLAARAARRPSPSAATQTGRRRGTWRRRR